jgi:hypothetical protein
MHDKGGRSRGKSRAALLWTLVCFLAGQAVLGLHLYRRHPEMCDPEFNFRLRDLKARLTEAPGRPLALVLGSSRPAFGFRPASARDQGAAANPEPVLYNFGMLGAGPVRERMLLRRLLRSGIKPDWLFVEVWTPFLPQRGFFGEEHLVFGRDMYWPDVPVMSRLYHRAWEAFGNVFEQTLAPAVHYRTRLLDRYAPFLLPPFASMELGFGDLAWAKLDGSGWEPSPFDRPDAAGFATQLEQGANLTRPLLNDFSISAVADNALRDLLEECRTHGIRTALFVMPEHSTLRSWYPPATQAELTAFLRGLGDDYQTPVIDARAWCADEDFTDYCHLRPQGARAFSERFGREVYRPLLEGRPLAKDILLH